ncbi:DUF4184 family protein [Aeromicrobium fastidiosum]|uniref:DUF4184 family protein n=1 Tax=Aeromicrobium fastidiosum TaxID=52699 RepID=A0A641ATV7_9ACTN|nr:DUF4184 family protein [Aeromicrobium fastidiosum]KAA1380308.1 DUF4184 family protein [Aeromicrobium fastidiosum]MBP2389863.1 hypothetical protein [Aeromicrobium fastidiosum]
MPLTLSHPAAVLPLRRLGLPASVMVIASMVPDVPLFLGSSAGYSATHAWTGVVTIDLLLTVGVVAVWFVVVRDALVDLAPDAVRLRLPPRARLDRRQLLLLPVAACLGSATHVVWDAFTHPGRWGVRQVGWLQADHAGLAGHQWAQYASGVIGLAIVAGAVLAHLRSAGPPDVDRPARRLPAATLPAVVGLAAAAGVFSALRTAPAALDLLAFNGVVDSLIVLTLGLVVVSLVWNARRP